MLTILIPPYSINHSHRSPAHSLTVIVKDAYCVRSPGIEDDEDEDHEAGAMASTAPATIAAVAMITHASGLLDMNIMRYMRDAAIVAAQVDIYDDRRDIFHLLPSEILTEILVLLHSTPVRRVLQEWNKGRIQRPANPSSNGLRDCYANRDLAKSDTVFSAMHNRNHAGNDKDFPILYRQTHDTLNNRGHNNLFKSSEARFLPLTMQCSYNLGPILGSSSSETLHLHGKNHHACTESVVIVKHGPCNKDETLNQREATNIIDTKLKTKRLHKEFEPSGSEFLQMTLFRDQHVSVIVGEAPQEWKITLHTTIGSGSTCGQRDLNICPLDHFIRKIEARHESLEHQIQMLKQKTAVASPMSPTGLICGEFKDNIPIHGSRKIRANSALHTKNKKGRGRHVLDKSGALFMDDRVETNGQDCNGQDYSTAGDRKQGSHSPEPKNFGMIKKDERRSTRATIRVSPRRLTFTPRRPLPALIYPNDGKAMISSANIYMSIKASLFAYQGSRSHRKLCRNGGNVHFPARQRGQHKEIKARSTDQHHIWSVSSNVWISLRSTRHHRAVA